MRRSSDPCCQRVNETQSSGADEKIMSGIRLGVVGYGGRSGMIQGVFREIAADLQITAPRTPIETGIQSVYACLAAKQSAEKGRFVDVRLVGQV